MSKKADFVKFCKERNFVLENVIYHSIAIIFIGYLSISLFLLNKQNTTLKVSIMPFLLKKQFILPNDRSVFIRGIRALEELMTQRFGVKILILYDMSKDKFFISEFECFLELVFSDQKKFDDKSQNILKFVLQKKNDLHTQSMANSKNKSIVFKQRNSVVQNNHLSEINYIFQKNEYSVWEVFVV